MTAQQKPCHLSQREGPVRIVERHRSANPTALSVKSRKECVSKPQLRRWKHTLFHQLLKCRSNSVLQSRSISRGRPHWQARKCSASTAQHEQPRAIACLPGGAACPPGARCGVGLTVISSSCSRKAQFVCVPRQSVWFMCAIILCVYSVVIWRAGERPARDQSRFESP